MPFSQRRVILTINIDNGLLQAIFRLICYQHISQLDGRLEITIKSGENYS